MRRAPFRPRAAGCLFLLVSTLVAPAPAQAQGESPPPPVEDAVRASKQIPPAEGSTQPTESAAPPFPTLFKRPVDLRYSIGFDFSRGDYDLDEDTDLYYVPMRVTADIDRFRARLTVPFLVTDGPTSVVPGIGAQEERTNSDTIAGLGQVQVGGSYLFDPLAELAPWIELAAEITIPTETDDDLGSGDWAFAFDLGFFRRYRDLLPFALAGRKFYTGSSLDDRFYATVGSSLFVTEAVSLGVSYSWLEATTSVADDAHEIVPFVSWAIDDRWTFSPYATIGLSSGSPDYGVGFTISAWHRRRDPR